MEVTNVLVISLVNFLIFLLIYYKFFAFKYWSNRNIQCIPASFPWGNLKQVMKRKIGFTEQINQWYFQMKHGKIAGLYFMQRKILLVTDPDLGKNVLSTDFKHFHNRGLYYDEKSEPLSAHLVALNGDKWKKLRAKLTPTFTPNKLKGMFDILVECANEMSKLIKDEKTVDIKDVSARYTTDVVGSTAFGIECNSLKDPQAEFRTIGKLATSFNQTNFFKRILMRNFPNVAKRLHIKFLHPMVSKFFMSAVEDMVQYRKDNNTNRNDFLQLLIKLMDNENVRTEEGEDALTLKQVAAQCFVFFIAGVETSASTITFAMYELARNKEMQDKLRHEIIETSRKYDYKFTYECISEMSYMDKIVLETMRKYPAFTIIMRRCTDDYLVPGTNFVLEKETPVCIPVYAIHHDPEYYPDPERFDPERFAEEEVKKRNDSAFIPFGDGPRICIGRRFAMFQVKLALAASLRDFEFTLKNKSDVEFALDPNSFVLSPKDPIYLNFEPISN